MNKNQEKAINNLIEEWREDLALMEQKLKDKGYHVYQYTHRQGRIHQLKNDIAQLRAIASLSDNTESDDLSVISHSTERPTAYKWLKESKFKIPQGATYNDPMVSMRQCATWISEYVKMYCD